MEMVQKNIIMNVPLKNTTLTDKKMQIKNFDTCLGKFYKFAKNHNWIVTGTYVDEGISGAKKNRPELDRMLKDALLRKFDVVATIELSRLGRSVKNMCEIADLLKQKNINLFVKNQNIDTSTIVGELFFNIINSISQYERDLTAERIKSGLENAKRKGVVLGRKSNLNLETQKVILDMKSQGIGLKKIAMETKVSVQTIRKLLSAKEIFNIASKEKTGKPVK